MGRVRRLAHVSSQNIPRQIWQHPPQRCCNSLVLSETHVFRVLWSSSSGWDSTGLRPAWGRPHRDTHHYVAWCSCSSFSASTLIMKTPPSALPLLYLKLIVFVLFVCRMSAPSFSNPPQHYNPSVAFWSSADAMFLLAECKSTTIAVFVCTLCHAQEQICVIRWCSYCK